MAEGAVDKAHEFHERLLIGDDVQSVELERSQVKALVVWKGAESDEKNETIGQ